MAHPGLPHSVSGRLIPGFHAYNRLTNDTDHTKATAVYHDRKYCVNKKMTEWISNAR